MDSPQNTAALAADYFDADVDRRNTGSTKWDRYRDRDVIPMWVADMDFRSPPPVLEALHRRVDHGVFGYGGAPAELTDTVIGWLRDSYGWHVEAAWLVWLPGLVCGLNVTCRALAAPDDAVLSATPVYYHLFQAPRNAGQQDLTVPLARDDGPDGRQRWTLDLDRIDAAAGEAGKRARLFMLCNPHNPVGRVFDRAELSALAELCQRRDLYICSDEIHCQLLLDDDKPHTPIAALDPTVAARTVTLMAPSKTYNMPGLGCSFAVIPNPELRRRFRAAAAGIVPHVNVLGYAATLAAYRDGGPWLSALLDYLRGNRTLIGNAVAGWPEVTMAPLEATYLAWLDARASGLGDGLAERIEQSGVGLSDGAQFGAPGYLRLNLGCPRSRLQTALTRLDGVFAGG